jgi:hypothetical protein
MNAKSKTGIELLQVALVIGLLGNILLRQMPWGLNVLLFNLAFVAGTVMLLLRRKPEYLTAQTWALLGAQIFFAAMFVVRDAGELKFADSVAIVAAMSVLIVPKLGIAPRVAGVFHYGVGFIWSSLNAAFGSIPLLTMDIDWKTDDRSAFTRNAVAVLRGVLIATPFILIFGALFVAADAAYEGLVNRVFDFNIDTAISHILITSVFAWASAGYLRAITLGKIPMSDRSEPPTPFLPEEGWPKAGVEGGAAGLTSDASNQTGGNGSGFTGGNATVRERAGTSTASKVADLKDDVVESSSLPDNATILEHINRSDPPQAETQAPPLPEEGWQPSSADGVVGAGSVPPEQKPKWSWSTIDNGFLPSAFTLGTVEVGIIFGLIDLLFVSFVVIQVPYLFGGMELVQNTPDFKLAEYARRGFGELVAVAALVLPLLLVAHWLIQKESARASALFKALAGVQLVLLFVIMASAVQRLAILTGPLGYGMTTVRLYPMIFMTWLAIVFVWFAMTVLRGSRQYFAWGALWSAFFILGATNFLNPDDFIVRTNIRLMQQGRDFDASYNSWLSADSVPALVASLPIMSADNQCRTKHALNSKYWNLGNLDDIRSLNFSRKSALQVLQANDVILHQLEDCPEWMQLPKDAQ